VAELLREERARMTAELNAIDKRIKACEQKAQALEDAVAMPEAIE
jgi:hypothetical protein